MSQNIDCITSHIFAVPYSRQTPAILAQLPHSLANFLYGASTPPPVQAVIRTMIVRRWHRRTVPPSRKVAAPPGSTPSQLLHVQLAGIRLINRTGMGWHRPWVRCDELTRPPRATTRPFCGSCRCGHGKYTLCWEFCVHAVPPTRSIRSQETMSTGWLTSIAPCRIDE